MIYTDNVNFLEQLRRKTPIPALYYLNTENSPYCAYSTNIKNSYLSTGCGDSEDLLYCRYVIGGRDNVDCYFSYQCELCCECTDCVQRYNCTFTQDCLYCERPIKGLKDMVDCAFCFDHSENCYEIVSGVKLVNSHFCYFTWFSTDLEYCEFVFNSRDCFGCVGLNHKAYHILNQPYERDEYFKKKAEIITEMKAQGTYGKHISSTFPVEDMVIKDYFRY